MPEHLVQMNAIVQSPSAATLACLGAIKDDDDLWGVTSHSAQTVALLNRIANLEREITEALLMLTPSPLIGLLDAVHQYKVNHESADEEVGRLRLVVEKLPTYEDTGERFVPGRDEAWFNQKGMDTPQKVCAVQFIDFRPGHPPAWELAVRRGSKTGLDRAKMYSTETAAESARATHDQDRQPDE